MAFAAETPAACCAAIIVTYQPDGAALQTLLARLQPQVATVLVLDNASTVPLPPLPAQVQYTALPDNLGLAHAQNLGIAQARQQGCSHVLLLDQDSLPAPDMVAQLLAALIRLENAGLPVAAVGPAYEDARTGELRPFVRFRWHGVWHEPPKPGQCLMTDLLIASGSLIPLERLQQVGLMEAGLFIDNIDLEWGFRAQQQGLQLYGVSDARMVQRIGETVSRFWLGRMRTLYRHAPVRQYYQTRNRLRLYRRAYVPRAWVVQDILRLGFKLMAFSFFIQPRLLHMQMFYRGIRDGVTDRSGKYPT